MLAGNLRNPFVLLLLVLRMSQEIKADRAARALTTYVVTTTTVRRAGADGKPAVQQVPTADVVVGDFVQNMLYDLCQGVLPWDRMDREFLARPRRWNAGNLPRFMLWLGPTSSVFDVITFAVLRFVLGATGHTAASQHPFQTGWFVVGLATQTLVIHLVRTRKIPFVQSTAARPVLVASVLTCAVGIWLPFSPVAPAISMVPLPAVYFAWLAAIVINYCVLTLLVKVLYIRRYGEWL